MCRRGNAVASYVRNLYCKLCVLRALQRTLETSDLTIKNTQSDCRWAFSQRLRSSPGHEYEPRAKATVTFIPRHDHERWYSAARGYGSD